MMKKNFFRGAMLALFTSFPLAGQAAGLEAGVECGATEDVSNYSNPGHIKAANLRLRKAAPFCQAFAGDFDGLPVPNNDDLLILTNNINDQNLDSSVYFQSITGFFVAYKDTVSNVSLDGKAVSYGEKINLSIEDAYDAVLQFDYDGQTYHFTLAKDAGSNATKSFVLQAGPGQTVDQPLPGDLTIIYQQILSEKQVGETVTYKVSQSTTLPASGYHVTAWDKDTGTVVEGIVTGIDYSSSVVETVEGRKLKLTARIDVE